MKKKKYLTLFSIFFVLIGVSLFFCCRLTENSSPSSFASGRGFNPKNATYTIDGHIVTLVNGVSVVPVTPGAASIIKTYYFGNEVTYDFDGDGRLDTAFLLTQNSGGSGLFYYLVIALNVSHGYIGTPGFLLGDRISPQTTEMSQNPATPDVIVVNYAERKFGEPFTATPSIGKSVLLKFDAKTGKIVRFTQ